MPKSELTKLRQKRSTIHRQLDKLEPLLARYWTELGRVEAAIQAVAPEMLLPPRRYRPNPYFARGELPRLALDIMRNAGEPLSTNALVRRAFAAKGVKLPDRRVVRMTRRRLQEILAVWSKRGLVVSVGSGRETRRGLASLRRSQSI